MVAQLLAPCAAQAGIDPLSGVDFVHIGAPGNAAWQGNGTPGDQSVGRGGVGYEYNIGKLEVTTAQWAEFFNAAFDRPSNDRIPFIDTPGIWGGVGTTPLHGGQRWRVPAGKELIPTGDISWRTAAVYCNWLNNGKSSDRAAFLNGAYDVSTFGYRPGTLIFTDQATHNPGAKYWIPTWDEQLKAFHFDPNKSGPGQPGWWTYSITRDTPPIGGPPPSLGGTGEANFGFQFGPVNPFTIPLGAYTNIASPWGLYDTAGATAEWSEGIQVIFGDGVARFDDGSAWTDSPAGRILDSIYAVGSDFPSIPDLTYGLRIASSIPSPGPCVAGLGALCTLCARRTRR